MHTTARTTGASARDSAHGWHIARTTGATDLSSSQKKKKKTFGIWGVTIHILCNRIRTIRRMLMTQVSLQKSSLLSHCVIHNLATKQIHVCPYGLYQQNIMKFGFIIFVLAFNLLHNLFPLLFTNIGVNS